MKKSYNGIIGLALADAMGVPVEFRDRSYLKDNPIKDVTGYGTYHQPPGNWSDDTSLTIATIDGIIANSGMITDNTYKSIADNFVSYCRYGSFTPGDSIFDIGNTTRDAILKYSSENCKPYEAGGKNEFNKGNGALMRILPLAYFSSQNNLSQEKTFEIVKKVSSITHRLDTCSLGSYIYVEFAKELIEGKSKEEAYSTIQNIDYSKFVNKKIVDEYSRILKNDISSLSEDEISSIGKTLPTLEASLWSFMKNNNYSDSILEAINLGDDTDTVGAITGGLAGIYYGIDSIPKEWLSQLAKKEYLIDLSNAYDESIMNKSIPLSYSSNLKHLGKPNEPYQKARKSIMEMFR